jgi:hypothetical protein
MLGPMMSIIHFWVAKSQLKLYVFHDESMYPSKHFSRRGPMEVKGEEVWVVERIVDVRKNN